MNNFKKFILAIVLSLAVFATCMPLAPTKANADRTTPACFYISDVGFLCKGAIEGAGNFNLVEIIPRTNAAGEIVNLSGGIGNVYGDFVIFEVLKTDISPIYLDVLLRNLRAAGVPVIYYESFMQDPTIEGNFEDFDLHFIDLGIGEYYADLIVEDIVLNNYDPSNVMFITDHDFCAPLFIEYLGDKLYVDDFEMYNAVIDENNSLMFYQNGSPISPTELAGTISSMENSGDETKVYFLQSIFEVGDFWDITDNPLYAFSQTVNNNENTGFSKEVIALINSTSIPHEEVLLYERRNVYFPIDDWERLINIIVTPPPGITIPQPPRIELLPANTSDPSLPIYKLYPNGVSKS